MSRDLHHAAAGVLVIATVVSVLALQAARPLFVPLLLGIFVSYILEPPVAALVRRGAPRALASMLVVAVMCVLVGITAYDLWNQAAAAAAKLPEGAQQLREIIERHQSPDGNPVSQVQKAADELKHLGEQPPAPPASQPEVSRVEIQPTSFNLVDYLWSSSTAAIGLAADALVVLVLALYLLIAGDLFRRHLIEIAGPTLSRRKVTLQLLDDISTQISRYLFVRVAISVFVAVGTTLVLWMSGVVQPAVWGIVAGAANVIPYAGPAAVAGGVGVAAFVQFHALGHAAVAVMLTVFVATLEAYVVTPWLTSRAAEMNAVAVFLGLVFWGWLWGLAGLFVAVPLMMVLKVICERVEELHPMAVLLSGAPPPRERAPDVGLGSVPAAGRPG